jgi:hypothetical protein
MASVASMPALMPGISDVAILDALAFAGGDVVGSCTLKKELLISIGLKNNS